MAHLIACIGSKKDTWDVSGKVVASGLFDKIYLVADDSVSDYVKPKVKPGASIEIIRLDYSRASEDLVPELYIILKKYFVQDKIQDLDIAVNIASGTGKEHAIIISTLMKLGYGIRLVDLDKDGNILEMI